MTNVRFPQPQRKGQRFVNPWPGFEQHGFADFLRWTVERRSTRRNRAKPEALVMARPAFSRTRAAPNEIRVTWIGHTTCLLQLGGLNVLTDPIWSERASPLSFVGPRRFTPPGVSFDELPPIDAVLISHDHYDHLDSRTVRRITARFPAAIWFCPLEVARFLRKRGAVDVRELAWGGESDLSELRVICVPAQHFSGRSIRGRDRTLWCGWVIKFGTKTIFFAGDTALNPSFADIAAELGPLDLTLLPIGAYEPRWFMRSVHIDPAECVRAVAVMAEVSGVLPILLATHWGTFALTDEPRDEPPTLLRKEWLEARLPPDHLWILAPGETRKLE